MKRLLSTTVLTVIAALLSLSFSSCTDPAAETPVPPTTDQTRAPSLSLDLFGLKYPIYTSQKITFRVVFDQGTVYGERVNIKVTDLNDGRVIPCDYEPGYYRYHFYVDAATKYEIEATYTREDGSTETAFEGISATQGIYMKLVTIEELPQNGYTVLAQAIHFFEDKACTQRIMSLERSPLIHVRLVKKAIASIGNMTHHYKDVTAAVPAGWSEGFAYRLYCVREQLPSGEWLEDYYEIEFLSFQN